MRLECPQVLRLKGKEGLQEGQEDLTPVVALRAVCQYQVLDRQGDALLFLSRDGFAWQVADILALLAQLHLSLAALHQCRVVKVAQVGADGLHRNVQTLR